MEEMGSSLRSNEDTTKEKVVDSYLKTEDRTNISERQTIKEIQELHSEKGQSIPEVNQIDSHIVGNNVSNERSIEEEEYTPNETAIKSQVLEEKRERSVRSRHLREVQQLKSENQKLRNELNQLKRSKTRTDLKNQKLNHLLFENEILIKIKECFELKLKNLFSDNSYAENDKILEDLVNQFNQYKRISNQSQTILKYKSVVNELSNEFNTKARVHSINVRRPRGRPPKEGRLKVMAQKETQKTKKLTNDSQITSKRLQKSNFRCDWPDCAYQCSRNKMLTEHINSAHTGERPYVCPMNGCAKSFSRSNTLDVHIKSCHSDIRRFKCNWEGCEAALKTKLGLSIHLQRHSGEKQFKCEWEGCAYRGMTKQRLDTHYMNHTGLRPFKCNWPGCEANFTSSDCLRSHLKSHSNLRPFVCDWPGCDAAFKANRALAIHKVIHTNENLFKCNSCDFVCNRYHILASHRLNHTGGRKFACNWPGCESKFDRRNKLELHLMIHRGDKPHKCPFNGCEKRFVEKGNMRKHYNSIHSKTF